MEKKTLFNEAYHNHAAAIKRLCLSYTGDYHDANDLLQEVFITVWNSWEKFRGESKISTWIYRIAVNMCLLHIKKNKKSGFVSQNLADNLPEENSDKEEQISLLHKSISQLKEADRIIITLFLEEKTYEEIAAITGITEGNLRVKIHRIKKELTEIFRSYGRL